MKTRRIFGVTIILALITILNSSFANKKVTIYHHTNGSQGYIVITVNASSLPGHAKHGDLYFTSLCPVDGPEYGCR